MGQYMDPRSSALEDFEVEQRVVKMELGEDSLPPSYMHAFDDEEPGGYILPELTSNSFTKPERSLTPVYEGNSSSDRYIDTSLAERPAYSPFLSRIAVESPDAQGGSPMSADTASLSPGPGSTCSEPSYSDRSLPPGWGGVNFDETKCTDFQSSAFSPKRAADFDDSFQPMRKRANTEPSGELLAASTTVELKTRVRALTTTEKSYKLQKERSRQMSVESKTSECSDSTMNPGIDDDYGPDGTKYNKGKWKLREEIMLMHVVYCFVARELKDIAQVCFSCGITRSSRSIDKKLKRIIGFDKWRKRDVKTMQKKLSSIMKENGWEHLDAQGKAALQEARAYLLQRGIVSSDPIWTSKPPNTFHPSA